ncbi:MAG: hypothetical protein Alpg2KO_15760 [Alphaproteobacteria bacterium]
MDASANPMPRLPDGPHWGLIESFDDLTTQIDQLDRQALVQTYRQQAIDAGMSIGRALIDWEELETAEGVFDEDALRDALDLATQGDVLAYVTLSTLDSTELTLPTYLEDPDGTVVDDNELSGDLVLTALENLLDWMVPILAEYDIFALSLGNEVEIPIEDGTVTLQDAVGFYEFATEHVRSLDADLATSLTFNSGATRNQPETLAALVPLIDVVMFNHGGLGENAQATDEEQWAEDYDMMADAAQGRQIIMQELGMSAGFEAERDEPDSVLASSPELQGRYFDFAADRFAHDPQFRAATLFQLLDWSEEAAALFADPLVEVGLGAFAEQVSEALQTTGLLRWADGSERPAWQNFTDALGLMQDVQNDDHKRGHRSELERIEGQITGALGYDKDQDWLDWQADAGDWRVVLRGDEEADTSLLGGRLRLYQADSRDLLKSAKLLDGGSAQLQFSTQDAQGLRLAVSGREDADQGAWSLSVYAQQKGGDDADSLTGTGAADWLIGAEGQDSLSGFDGADVLRGGTGRDTLTGGRGQDTLSGGRGNDDLRGGTGDDLLEGHRRDDTLRGGPGEDYLDGGNGNDVLDGGKGQDVLNGGRGADIFVFAHADSTLAAPDQILDFDAAQDRIQLDFVDQISGPDPQGFSFVGSDPFTGSAGQIRAADGRLEIDLDGDSQADWAILLATGQISDDSFLIL